MSRAWLRGWLVIVALAALLSLSLRRDRARPVGITSDYAEPVDPPEPDPLAEAPPPSATPPVENVILITIDTVRWDALCPRVTPNLSALADRSTLFERAYALASYTGKSIGPMLIGRYPSETDRNGNHFTTYGPSNVFLAERLRDDGVFTMGAASHWYFQSWSGLSQGMEEWSTRARPTSGQGEEDTSITSVELTNEAIEMLSHAGGRRFFFWVHYLDPHAQYMPHEGAPDFSDGATSPAALVRAMYDAELWFTDREIGRLLEYIGGRPWAATTAIVVTSDHGEAFGEHAMSWHGVELWECLVRVPLLVHLPGAAPRRVSARRSLVDLAPTVLELMNVEAPAGELSGASLLRDVDGERAIYLDMPAGPYSGMRRGLIDGDMKIVQIGASWYRLFDLATDPGEENDLAGDGDALQAMVAKLERTRASLRELEVPPGPP